MVSKIVSVEIKESSFFKHDFQMYTCSVVLQNGQSKKYFQMGKRPTVSDVVKIHESMEAFDC